MEQARKQQIVARGRVRSINVSKRKGTRKMPCEGGATVVAHRGLDTDAHAGDWHRQVSLLAWESIEKARATGLDVVEGDFAENVTTEGIDLLALPLGTRVRIGEDVLLELSQIGKVCHTKCAIYHLAGDCIFPREGIFFVALEGGAINVGDPVEVVSLGDGTCAYTPPEALAELARLDSTKTILVASWTSGLTRGRTSTGNTSIHAQCIVQHFRRYARKPLDSFLQRGHRVQAIPLSQNIRLGFHPAVQAKHEIVIKGYMLVILQRLEQCALAIVRHDTALAWEVERILRCDLEEFALERKQL